MSQKIFCKVCSNEVQPPDKFCSSCGAKVDESESSSVKEQKVASVVCKLCGNQNPASASYCESCGNALATPKISKNKPEHSKTTLGQPKPLSFFQSWKFTVAMALLLIIVVVVARLRKSDEEQPAEPTVPVTQGAVVEQIESLQKAVDANPNDARAILQLANHLQDAKFFPRAIMMYERYLKVNPTDVEAQVDCGVSYFELALVDSAHQLQNLHVAEIGRAHV